MWLFFGDRILIVIDQNTTTGRLHDMADAHISRVEEGESAIMGQINVNPNASPSYDDNAGARTAASNNLTWAIAMVLIIAAVVVAIVYVSHNVHF